VASAALTENVDAYSVPQDLRALVRQIDDPVLRESTRDIAGNKRFRRDLFARGTARSNPAEQLRLLSALSFALVVPRQRVTLKFHCALGELTGKDKLYLPIIDRLAQSNATFGDLLSLPAYGPRASSRRTRKPYAAAATIASATPIQNNTMGHSVPSSVTMTRQSDAYRTHVATRPRKLTSNG